MESPRRALIWSHLSRCCFDHLHLIQASVQWAMLSDLQPPCPHAAYAVSAHSMCSGYFGDMQAQEPRSSGAAETQEARPQGASRPGFTHIQPLLSPFQDNDLQTSFPSPQQNGHAPGPPVVQSSSSAPRTQRKHSTAAHALHAGA